MSYYKLGKIPHKRHTVFKDDKGNMIYEQLFGTEGFDGIASLLYHIHRPTQMLNIGEPVDDSPKAAIERNLSPRLVRGLDATPADDFIASKTPVFFNDDAVLGVAAPKKSMTEYFYKNGHCDELFFVHKGSGTFHTLLGDIPFKYGDYLVVPRGTIYQFEFDDEDNRLLYIESFSPIKTPDRYRNNVGQFLEHSPFCERDFRMPEFREPVNEKGEFLVKVKKQGKIYPVTYATHPFDVVGWDGYFYPYAFSIFDFEPITGRIHMPPPIHLQFQSANFVVCSFVPRLYDYHPLAVPAPYNHSNIDTEEILYYVDGDFMSRNHIEKGYFTLHPGGIAHGPHPGAIERSVGQKETKEMAVMVDFFHPVKLTEQAVAMQDPDYVRSWLEP